MNSLRTFSFIRWFLIGFTAFLAAACEKAQEGMVDLPIASIECRTPKCRQQSGPMNSFIYITGSSCSAISFDLQATGSVTLLCNSLGCSGEVRSWYGRDEQDAVTAIEAGYYSVCGLIDLNNSISGETDPFNDNADVHLEMRSVDFGSVGSRLTLDDWMDP